MQRWHLTSILAFLAVTGAIVAPRLSLSGSPSTADDVPPGTADVLPPTPVVPPQTPPVAPPAPQAAGHVRVEAGLDRTMVAAGTSNERYLVVTLTADQDVARRPVALGIVVDTSGSMSREGKMRMAREAAEHLAETLGPEDHLDVVAFSASAATVYSGPGGSPLAISAIEGLHPGGETDMEGGLLRGGDDLAGVRTDVEKRLVLVTDGYATIGDKSAEGLARRVRALGAEHVSVSTVGLGIAFDGDLLTRLASEGGGNYAFVDDGASLDDALRQEVASTSTLVARDATVHVTLPAGVELVDFVGKQASRSGDGWNVDVGDLSAGETRKVVARVRVEAGAPGSVPVATIAASWDDRIDQAPRSADVAVAATSTVEVAVAEKSYDPKNNVAANEAMGGWFMDRAARAWDRGDADEARKITVQAQQTVAPVVAEAPAPELAELNDKLDAQAARYQFADAPVAGVAGPVATTPAAPAAAPPEAKPSRKATLQEQEDAFDYMK